MELSRIPVLGRFFRARDGAAAPDEGPSPHLRAYLEQFGQKFWDSAPVQRAKAWWIKTEQSTRRVTEALQGADVLGVGKQGLREHFWLIIGFSAAINLLYLAPSLYMLQVYDRVLPTGALLTLVLLSVVLVVGLAVLALLDAVRSRLLARAALRVERLAGDAVIQETMRARRMGVQPAATARDLDTLRQGITSPAAIGLLDLPWTPLFVGICFVIHFWIGMLALGGAVAILGLALVNERATRGALSQLSAKAGGFYIAHDSDLGAAETIHALGAGARMRQRRARARAEYIDAHTDSTFKGAGFSAATKALRMLLQSAALGLGAYLAVQREISPGAIIAATILTARAFAPVEQIVGGWRQIGLAAAAYNGLRKLFGDAKQVQHHTPLPEPKGRIQLEQVSALAPDGRTVSLQQASFIAGPAEIVGIIGPSGAGKTTLARVLANAAVVKLGAIRIDGARYADWDETELAHHIGYLPQRIDLFDGTVADNIASFAPPIDQSGAPVGPKVVAAAMLAGAHEMILRLPRGYETELGPSGSGISPGQAQRIALARALFGDPTVIVLDEPNSHLDADGELALVGALEAVRARGGTVFVVAHRAGVVKAADKLIVLQDGRIAECGPQASVLAKLANVGKTQINQIAAGAQS
jgi:PrtD family type I secretion system ABC transporter